MTKHKESSLFKEPRLIRFSWMDFAKTALCLGLGTGMALFFDALGFTEANIITVYLLDVLFISVWTGGQAYGAAASLVSVLVFNFFFTAPRFSFMAYDAEYPVTFLIMLTASLITSTLTRRIKDQTLEESRKAYHTQVLLETSQKLQEAEGEDFILEATAVQLRKLLDCSVTVCPVREGEPRTPSRKGALCLPVRGKQGVLAEVLVDLEGKPGLDAFARNLLLAILDECGMMLEKMRVDAARREMEETARQEALRATLLRAISHDLRTPLTSISGNAAILMQSSSLLTEGKKLELYAAICDDALWLSELVENLLSVTRIENGTMSLHMEQELLDEIIQEAMAHIDRKAAERVFTVWLEDELLMARMDARLIVQVLINLLNNAVKYTPPGSHIDVLARREGDMVKVSIADDGPGVPESVKEKIFDMFYTGNNARGDGRRGLGLGLALCKSIITAHGGTISEETNVPHGAIFSFTLHSTEVEPVE